MPRTVAKFNSSYLFEEAREATIKLAALSRELTNAELEALQILFERHAMSVVAPSSQAPERSAYEPIDKIL
jgi:hypothetical protein